MELKPCPFCKSNRIKYGDIGIMRHIYYCLDCGGSTGRCRTKDDAEKAWNQRADGWHKWPEEKPDNDGCYLCYSVDNQQLDVLEWIDIGDGRQWYDLDYKENTWLTHWMDQNNFPKE